MLVIHTHWSGGALRVWAETGRAPVEEGRAGAPPDVDAPLAPTHTFGATPDELRLALRAIAPGVDVERDEPITLLLPSVGGAPAPSPRLAHARGRHTALVDDPEHGAMRRWSIPAILVDAGDSPALLEALEDAAARDGGGDVLSQRALPAEIGEFALGPTVHFFAAAARHARSLLAEERFVPMLYQSAGGALRAGWAPWLGDEHTAARTGALLRAMPHPARAVEDPLAHDPWAICEAFLGAVIDAHCRQALRSQSMIEAVEGRDPNESSPVAWLRGLLDEPDEAPAAAEARPEMVRAVRQWIARLDDRGADAAWRLRLLVEEPAAGALLEDFETPDDDLMWVVRFQLQAAEDERASVDAEEIWSGGAPTTVSGLRLQNPQEILLNELGRATRLYKPLERALDAPEPARVELTTTQIYEFLREIRPLLLEVGVADAAPPWWDSPSARLGVRLQIDSDPAEGSDGGASGERPGRASLGLCALVDYQWRIAVGGAALTIDDLERLASQSAPLVRVGGKWVEIRQRDLRAAARFLRENPGGQMTLGEALHMAYDAEPDETGVEILGLEARGWVSDLFAERSDERLPKPEQPEGFVGSLRPYQLRGLAWLAFLEKHGLGACLADDMGLGKTIQLLALALMRRDGHAPPGPSLVVAPMSVVENWQREARRFAPSLSALVHHGPERLTGDALVERAGQVDLFITTYALVNRYQEDLKRVQWGRIVLDEAQNIKNPGAKQSQAVRSLPAARRIALTGTPVENRLSELWSIMQFCNPGWLGSIDRFRRRFAAPIEKRHDKARRERLRALVQPFVLRRLKSDPNVTADLPPKVESKEYCVLTPEQAALYQAVVNEMLGEVDRAEGVRRRGVVLAMLVKLKQICNHPAQLTVAGADEDELRELSSPDPARSGKATRLLEMLDEALSAGDQALIFTQFRKMGGLLSSMIMQAFDRETLFLHGGTPQKMRQQMIDRFQKADGSAPVFILSLKAGGVGMNLTAASHVFHYDRWWNPAVENQATDRAHRIGQTRTVQVHKFVVAGTLEERIDQMIEEKTELAQTVIGAGDQWLTELSTSQLREILRLRPEAIADE